MRTITLEEHFATPGFLDGPGRQLKDQALQFDERAIKLISFAISARAARANSSGGLGVAPAPRPAQDARAALASTRPVPLQTLQVRRLPRSRTQPVPKQRMQVSCTTRAGPGSRIATRLPKFMRIAFWCCVIVQVSGILSRPR
jgi:hypothetical protein